MKIKNSSELSKNSNRTAMIGILEEGLVAIDTHEAIVSGVTLSEDTLTVHGTNYSLSGIKNIYVVGIGKCSFVAAKALEEVLGNRITSGIVLDIAGGDTLKYIQVYIGDHPFPTERNVQHTKKIISFLENASDKDLVIFIISGGGSTLLCQPQNMTYKEEEEIVKRLFDSGAVIEELNTVRKHLSLARGGHLAQYAYPAKVISLIFSDVPGNNAEFIASGPTVRDSTTVSDAKEVLAKYDMTNCCNIDEDNFIETPKDDMYFENVSNILFVTNKTALSAMKKKAESLGFFAEVRSTSISGEARDIGKHIIEEIKNKNSKTVLLYGGESTVTKIGDGHGGRNQELALSTIQYIDDSIIVASVASDGRDNSDYAGALCDIITKQVADTQKLNLIDFLNRNDSITFFEKVGDHIITSSTGSNVSDLIVAIKI